jgi:hypothetical protein
LFTIRKLLIEGKLINKEGMFSMEEAVIEEMRVKEPAPIFKSKNALDALKTFKKTNTGANSAKKSKPKHEEA